MKQKNRKNNGRNRDSNSESLSLHDNDLTTDLLRPGSVFKQNIKNEGLSVVEKKMTTAMDQDGMSCQKEKINKITKDNSNKEHKSSTKKNQDKMSEIDMDIARRYEIKSRLGKGAYGIVWKAIDKKTKEVVAIKKIYDAFRNQTDAQRTFREIIFLQSFRNHPNIVKLHNIHRAANNRDIYLGFEYMNSDLHNVIKSGNILKNIHKRYIMYQILNATKYIHSGNVIHRDQKPSNVLIDNACRVKIADFGLARSVSSCGKGTGEGGADPCLTDYVATRWYRAPEILIASRNYTKGIDMWSLGCILGEMLIGEPLFPGSSTVNQVERIMACIPVPTEEDIQSVCTGYGSSLVRTAVSRRTPLKDVLLRNSSLEAADLVCRLLVFNPGRRPTAQQALQHAYVARFHKEKNEPVLAHDVIPPLCDDRRLSIDEYRNRLYELMERGSSRNAEKNSDSASTALERTKSQTFRGVRSQNIGPAACNKISKTSSDNSDSASTTLERTKASSTQTFRVVRSQNLGPTPCTRISKTSSDNSKPNLNTLLAHYTHKPHNVQSEHKNFSNIDAVSRIHKKLSENKADKPFNNYNSAFNSKANMKEERRNPLHKNVSMDDYITYPRNEHSSDACVKCKNGTFIRSMSDESYSNKGRNGVKTQFKNSSSINNLHTQNFEGVGRSSPKFSQKHGIITASALMELRSNFR